MNERSFKHLPGSIALNSRSFYTQFNSSLKWQTLERRQNQKISKPSQGGFLPTTSKRFRVLFMRQQANIIVTVYHHHRFTLKMTTTFLRFFCALFTPTSKHNIIISLASTFALEKCFKAIMNYSVLCAIGDYFSPIGYEFNVRVCLSTWCYL